MQAPQWRPRARGPGLGPRGRAPGPGPWAPGPGPGPGLVGFGSWYLGVVVVDLCCSMVDLCWSVVDLCWLWLTCAEVVVLVVGRSGKVEARPARRR